MLPLADDTAHVAFARKGQEGMGVVRHQQEQQAMPAPVIMVMAHETK